MLTKLPLDFCPGNPMIDYTQQEKQNGCFSLAFLLKFLSVILHSNHFSLLHCVYILPGSYFYLLPYQWHLSFILSRRKDQSLIKKLQVTKNSPWGRNSEHSILVIGLRVCSLLTISSLKSVVSLCLGKSLTKSLSFIKLTASGKLPQREVVQKWNHCFVLC